MDNVKLLVQESNIDDLSIMSGLSKAKVLMQIMETISILIDKYESRILNPKECTSEHGYPCNFKHYNCKHFRSTRVFRLPDRSKGMNLKYTFLYKDEKKEELTVFVKLPRKKWTGKEYTYKDVYDMYATDQIESMLTNKE